MSYNYKKKPGRNKYGLEHFQRNLDRLDSFLRRSKGNNLVSVFDIGTKAARLLVGYKEVPKKKEDWNPSAFFNDGQVFNLGDDFNIHDRMLNVDKSEALEGIIYFINVYKEKLQKDKRVSTNDISAIGTAIFRWLKNRDEVIDKIESETGIDLFVLEENDEALLSSISVYHTTSWVKSYSDNEAILLFDQGGGSTEVSYFSPNKLTLGKQDSINDLGTVVLQKLFFGLNNDEMIDPKTNRRRISTQFQRINKYIENKIDSWEGFPEIMDKKTDLNAFGMGTAILKCFSVGSNYSQHNKRLSTDDMNNILNNYARSLEASNQQVRTLYNLVEAEEKKGNKKVSKQLVLLYGLPVYQKMLEKFKIKELRYASYGLRYGAYIAKYHFKLDLSDLNKRLDFESKSKIEEVLKNNVIRRRPIKDKIDTGKRFKVAFSFPGEHRDFVENVADKLAKSIGKKKVFYDKYYESELARPNLDTYLQDIYHQKSEKIVVFICAEYDQKEWCGLEWRAIRDLIKKRKDDDIIFVRVGAGDVKGVYSIDGYLDANKYNDEEISDFILQRL